MDGKNKQAEAQANEKKPGLTTFYSTTSNGRKGYMVPEYMSQNMLLAKRINRDYKKLHF